MKKRVFNRLQLDLKPSKYLSLYFNLLHIGLLIYLQLCPIPMTVVVLVSAIVIVSWILGRNTHARGRQPISSIEWESNGDWVLTDNEGRKRKAVPLNGNFSTGWMTILGFRVETSNPLYVMLLPDSAEPGLLRRLRVQLREKG